MGRADPHARRTSHGEYREALVAFDVAKMKRAIAIAEGGRTGEVRYLGEPVPSSATIAAVPTRDISSSLRTTRAADGLAFVSTSNATAVAAEADSSVRPKP